MKDISFEKALEDLENTVEKLEKGGLSLNESLALFEKGIKLAKFLRQELEKAEKKIEIFLKDEEGNVKKAPFASTGDEGESSNEEDPSRDEDSGDLPF
ncbi:MAG: exodeoxyribonuclease VII small subunit [Candidatus Aminicenantes bacterium]|nr:exodeoxyribonuclease VII small subunit [Candidatus Aminicenantes bacterium]